MVERLHNQGTVQSAQQYGGTNASGKTQANGFGALLQARLEQGDQQSQEVTFSKHARSRAEERGIEINQSLIDQLKGGMIRAQAKGATNILAMDAEKAFIINVPNAKVITAITQDEMGESVFTNIDGAVFL